MFMNRRQLAALMIFAAALLVLLMSVVFYSQQSALSKSCAPYGSVQECSKNGLDFSIFGFILVLVLFASAYHVLSKSKEITGRWAIISMVTALLAYEVTEFAYLVSTYSYFYSSIGAVPQYAINAGYIGTGLAFIGGLLALTARSSAATPKAAGRHRRAPRRRKR